MSPKRAPRPCAEPGCPVLVDGESRCPAHRRAEWKRYDEARGTAAERGYDERWRRARERFLRKHPFCGHCKAEDKVTVATVVDHIEPVDGPDDPSFFDESNFQSLCHGHHNKKTASERSGAGPARAPKKKPKRSGWTWA